MALVRPVPPPATIRDIARILPWDNFAAQEFT